jgi:hypothetical protein
MAAATKPPSQLAQLAAQFAPEEHKNRAQGGQTLTYISIDATIKRLNEVLGPGWSTEAATRVDFMASGNYLAVCELTLRATIDGSDKQAYGVGAMTNRDPDMAAKTALAEAIKKAGHQLGIGLYLWDPAARDSVNRKAALAKASTATLKKAVFNLAQTELGIEKPTQAQMAKLFGVKAGDLQDDEILRMILTERGQL